MRAGRGVARVGRRLMGKSCLAGGPVGGQVPTHCSPAFPSACFLTFLETEGIAGLNASMATVPLSMEIDLTYCTIKFKL